MTRGRPRLSRVHLSFATLLLILQAGGSGMVAWAHAREPLPGAVSFEAQHGAKCPVLHDEDHCALCQYAGARIVLLPSAAVPTGDLPHASPLQADLPLPTGHRRALHSQPRAPPFLVG
jgi:hypothetical protein